MYTGYEIEAGSRQKLATLFPPKYPNFMGHHITEAFGVKDGSVPEQPRRVLVVSHIDNGEDVEGFVVSIDGSSKRPDGGTYHLTWSLDRSNGAKPVHTNNHIDSAEPLKQPIEIDVSAKFFTGAGQSYAKGEYRG